MHMVISILQMRHPELREVQWPAQSHAIGLTRRWVIQTWSNPAQKHRPSPLCVSISTPHWLVEGWHFFSFTFASSAPSWYLVILMEMTHRWISERKLGYNELASINMLTCTHIVRDNAKGLWEPFYSFDKFFSVMTGNQTTCRAVGEMLGRRQEWKPSWSLTLRSSWNRGAERPKTSQQPAVSQRREYICKLLKNDEKRVKDTKEKALLRDILWAGNI